VVRLHAQPFKVLVLLASRPQELVTRDELREAIWNDGTVVDFEHGLNTCISQIRRALGDDGHASKILETVPKLGYRFKAEVEPVRRPSSARHAAWIGALATVAAAGVLVTWNVARRGPPDPRAVALYEKGTAAANLRTTASHDTARRLLDQAIAVDPRYAEPHAALARLYLTVPLSLTGLSPDEATRRGELEARRALAIDPTKGEPHLALAQLHMTRGHRAAADAEFEAAARLEPASALVHEQYGMWLGELGRFDEALRHARLSETQDPLSVRSFWSVVVVLRFARRWDEALAEARKGLAVDPTFGPLHHEIGLCFEAVGRLPEAITEFEKTGEIGGNLGHAYAVAGRTAEARAVLETLETRWAATHAGAGGVAQVYVGLGETERAFEWLFKGLPIVPPTLKVASVWDPLRADPRFAELLAKGPFDE